MTSLTLEAVKPIGHQAARRRAIQELLRPRASSAGCTPGRPSRPCKWIQKRFAKTPMVARGQHPGLQGGLELRRDGRAVPVHLRGQAGRPRARHCTPTSRATPPWRGVWSRPASWPSCPLFLGSYPITPASDILHELSKHKNFGVRTLQAEDEIAGIGAALGAAYAGSLGDHHDQRPGHRPQVRDHRAGRQPGAAAADHRHPAGRAVDRTADQDRAGRPPPGHVRPARGGAGPDRGPLAPRATASMPPSRRPASPSSTARRCSCSLTATWPTEPSPGRSPTWRPFPTSACRSPPRPTTRSGRDGGVLAVPPRPRHPGPALGDSRDTGLDASHRRPGEGGRLRRRVLRPGQPRADDQAPGRQGGRDRRRHPPG